MSCDENPALLHLFEECTKKLRFYYKIALQICLFCFFVDITNTISLMRYKNVCKGEYELYIRF